MAFDFLKELHQNALERAWNTRPDKPKKDPMPARREKVIAGIDKALQQLKANEANPKRGFYQTKDGVEAVRVQVKYGAKPLAVSGRNAWFVPDAAVFFNKMKAAAKAGELDSAINEAAERKGEPTAPRGPSGRKGRKMDPSKVYNRNLLRYGEQRANELRDRVK